MSGSCIRHLEKRPLEVVIMAWIVWSWPTISLRTSQHNDMIGLILHNIVVLRHYMSWLMCKYAMLVYMHMHLRIHYVCFMPSNYNTVTNRQASGQALPPATISPDFHSISRYKKNLTIRALKIIIITVCLLAVLNVKREMKESYDQRGCRQLRQMGGPYSKGKGNVDLYSV